MDRYVCRREEFYHNLFSLKNYFSEFRQVGVRLLTFFLYLNDVEEGGGTNFNKLGITITPKRGRATLWPSVLNERPNDEDDRTTHQALAVKKGLKYAGKNLVVEERVFPLKLKSKNFC